jgi:hypothetical protein
VLSGGGGGVLGGGGGGTYEELVVGIGVLDMARRF